VCFCLGEYRTLLGEYRALLGELGECRALLNGCRALLGKYKVAAQHGQGPSAQGSRCKYFGMFFG